MSEKKNKNPGILDNPIFEVKIKIGDRKILSHFDTLPAFFDWVEKKFGDKVLDIKIGLKLFWGKDATKIHIVQNTPFCYLYDCYYAKQIETGEKIAYNFNFEKKLKEEYKNGKI